MFRLFSIGGTGIPIKVIQKAISLSTAKINVNAENQMTSTKTNREVLTAHPNMYDRRKYLGALSETIKETVIEKMKEFGSVGKAK